MNNQTPHPVHGNLVVFDTCVVAGRYLAPLLRGEELGDLQLLSRRSPPHQPAVLLKTLYELSHLAKLGRPQFPWMQESLGYPGGIDRGHSIVSRVPALDQTTTYWWFNISEEWRALDWTQEVAKINALCVPSQVDSALHELEVRREFAAWKFGLSAFCEKLWDSISSSFAIVSPRDVYGAQGEHYDRLLALERDLALFRLAPSEDFEIVAACLALNASALVTQEKALLRDTAFAMTLDCQCAFVHPDKLAEAVEADFAFRAFAPATR